MKLIYLATTKSEVSLIVDLLHKCYGQRDTDEEVADGGNKYVIYILIYWNVSLHIQQLSHFNIDICYSRP